MQSITRFCLLLAAVNVGGLAPSASSSVALANPGIPELLPRHDHHHEHTPVDVDDEAVSIPSPLASPPSPPPSDSSSPHAHSASGSASALAPLSSISSISEAPPDHHHHHGPVKTVLDEVEIERWHGKTPVSWLYYDWVLSPAERVQVSLEYGDVGRRTTLGRRHGEHEGNGAETEEHEESAGHAYHEGSVSWDEEVNEKDSKPPSRPSATGRRSDALSHPYIVLIHIVAFSSAFFVCLPLSLALKTAKVTYFKSDARGSRRLHGPGAIKAVADVGYWSNLLVGWLSGLWYRSATPNLYEGQAHSLSGYLLLLTVIAISFVDIVSLIKRIVTYTQLSANQRGMDAFGDLVLSGMGGSTPSGSGAISPLRLDGDDGERTRLAQGMELQRSHDDADADEVDLLPESTSHSNRHDSARSDFSTPWREQAAGNKSSRHVRILDMPAAESRRMSRLSNASDSTLRDSASPSGSDRGYDHHPVKAADLGLKGDEDDISSRHASPNMNAARQFVKFFMIFLNRALVMWAFVVAVMGICVYCGVGRRGYINGLLAHWIKGSIFFWYGILTFARYLGAWAEYGWAWNAHPASKRNSRVPSAEFVECFVIFLYGISNTWLERLGAAPGSPYSIKQVQHISIAIMFWFAGLIGMGMETKTLKRWLGAQVASNASRRRGALSVESAEPATYAASFNPFPALVIGVLGIAMSAHHQDYQFQVTIHALWGYLLAGFALLRLLTYFLLYVAPMPSSVMPGRPPTEAMAATSLACGGVVFVLSDEEVTFAAMRHGWDDMMAFLNLTVAAVCLLFCWVLAIMVIKGWAVTRSRSDSKISREVMFAGDHAEESALVD